MSLDVLQTLYKTISDRANASPEESYSAKLIAGGPAYAGRKLAEESVETLIAAMQEDDGALMSEAADVLFHLLAVLVARNVSLDAVYDELRRREGMSGLAEKASRGEAN